MKTLSRLLIFQIILLFPFNSYCQEVGEWLVEMNPDDGTFEAVGPLIENVYLIYPDMQCKDETNGQYIFLKSDNPDVFVSVDISNGEIVDETDHPLGNLPWMWGFHCYGNCDTLVILCRDDPAQRFYVALFERFNGTEMILIGDSIPDDNPAPWNLSTNRTAFDPINSQLYMYSEFASLLRVMDIPSGNLVSEHPINNSFLRFITYDEISNKLYGLEFYSSSNYRLIVFDDDVNNFVPVGDIFTSTGQWNLNYFSSPTIDGNNQRMFVTSGGSSQGSFMMSIDLITGELITDVQTMPESGGSFGGPNTVNGQYFNSTDQLITLHWGEGSTITSTEFQSGANTGALISPNPNQGVFKIDLNGYPEEMYQLKVVNLAGQIVYENQYLRKGQSIDINLSAGYYIANVLSTDGSLFVRIPFVVDTKE